MALICGAGGLVALRLGVLGAGLEGVCVVPPLGLERGGAVARCGCSALGGVGRWRLVAGVGYGLGG